MPPAAIRRSLRWGVDRPGRQGEKFAAEMASQVGLSFSAAHKDSKRQGHEKSTGKQKHLASQSHGKKSNQPAQEGSRSRSQSWVIG
jgi:hypothetical protein